MHSINVIWVYIVLPDFEYGQEGNTRIISIWRRGWQNQIGWKVLEKTWQFIIPFKRSEQQKPIFTSKTPSLLGVKQVLVYPWVAIWSRDLDRHYKGRKRLGVSLHDISEYVWLRKVIDCDKCDYKATRLDNLKAHKHTAHGGGNYNCDKCDNHQTMQD